MKRQLLLLSIILLGRIALAQNFDFVKQFGSSGSDWGTCTTTDDSGNIYTTGFFSGTVDFDPGVGVQNLTSSGNSDIFISKMNSVGQFIWAKKMGGSKC